MTSYERTIIFEANHANSVESTSIKKSSNDFTVQIPPLEVPRGSQIALDGAIIQQTGANSSIIELSNENFSSDFPYQSSFMGIEYLTYINHTGMNMVVYPVIAANQLEIDTSSNDGQHNVTGSNISNIPYRSKQYLFFFSFNEFRWW